MSLLPECVILLIIMRQSHDGGTQEAYSEQVLQFATKAVLNGVEVNERGRDE